MRSGRRTTPALDWSQPDPAAPVPKKPSKGSGTCHGALLVATGQLDAFLLLGAGPWDIAVVIPIVQEAGGVFSDLFGRQRADTGAALFARPGLHAGFSPSPGQRGDTLVRAARANSTAAWSAKTSLRARPPKRC
ncbi:inositol monophosphatase [Streptomyces sp. SAS_269]|uniref:inositol monophosphatase family protein n=1 Tax=Streptomyces sp. SAS_269 TaxID=3412749 RepID=UPI00403CD0D0